jgi:hypothetical protein
MRAANLAILKEHFPMSITEVVLWDLNDSTVFNHFDFNLPYHKIELATEPRAITAFKTYQYVQYANCATEIIRRGSSRCPETVKQS